MVHLSSPTLLPSQSLQEPMRTLVSTNCASGVNPALINLYLGQRSVHPWYYAFGDQVNALEDHLCRLVIVQPLEGSKSVINTLILSNGRATLASDDLNSVLATSKTAGALLSCHAAWCVLRAHGILREDLG